MKKLTCLLMAIILVSTAVFCVYANEDSADAILFVDNTAPSVGDTITVSLKFENITSGKFVGCDAAIYYNNEVLEYDAEHGIVLDSTLYEKGLTKIFSKTDENLVRCAVAFDVNSIDKMPAEVGENTTVWTVKFKVKAEGDTNLQFAVEGKAPKYSATVSEGVVAFLGDVTKGATLNLKDDVSVITTGGEDNILITEIIGITEITVPVGSASEDVLAKLPSEVDVKLDNGEIGKVKMSWIPGSLISGFDGNTPGEYYFTGNIADSGEYVNINNLFSMVKVIVSGDTASENNGNKTEIVMVIGSSQPTINGEVAPIDVPAMILGDRTMTPARFVAEALGAEVLWHDTAKTVTIIKGESKIVLTIDSKTAEINGNQVEIDVPATIIDSRTLTPARLIAEALGAEVSWDDTTRTVTIVK